MIDFSLRDTAEQSAVEFHAHDLQLMANAKIMMVDDEPLNMEVLQVHLEDEGYNCFITVDDSTQAVTIMRREQPDVLLLDLVMPAVSGFDILQEVRIDAGLKHIPVIVLTSSNDADTKLKALRLGATDFLAKPVDASELALRMRNTLTARAYQQRMLHYDQLTDLPNRLYFTSLLSNSLNNLQDAVDQCALIVINIVRFKAINDSMGPECGDSVLGAFSQRMCKAFAVGDNQIVCNGPYSYLCHCVGRFGGDQFAVHIPVDINDTDHVEVMQYLQSFVTSLEEPFVEQGQDIYLTVKMGVSIMSAETSGVKTLINNAETAMMHAKEHTNVNFAFYSPQMDTKARERLSIENGMRTAVEKGEIYLAYQPKLSVESNAILGAEALIRWMHPEFGMLSPGYFIPIAESSGMIVPVGEWVLRESCRQAVEWRLHGHTGFKIAVNVSVRQLFETNFVRTVEQSLADSGLPAEALIIELTENMLMEKAETSIIKLEELKELGVQISVDDFGTGYSSLSYLQRFPLDQLKIDQSFVREIKSFDDKMPIVKAVISLAHDLGLDVVAEGIETHHQLAHMKSLRCEEYQGYLFSKPISSDEFSHLLQGQKLRSA